MNKAQLAYAAGTAQAEDDVMMGYSTMGTPEQAATQVEEAKAECSECLQYNELEQEAFWFGYRLALIAA